MSTTGWLHSYETFGAVDGPGIRFVAFLQGCPLRCKYCHNPDTWAPNKGELITAYSLVEKIKGYRNFIKSGGVTLSGGEPLLQASFCCEVLQLCRQNGLHTAIDTAGCIPLEQCKAAVDLTDLILLDIKDLNADNCKRLTGQDNQNALRLLDYCESMKKPVWIRHVVVDGYTNDWQKIATLAQFVKQYTCIEKVELLPFHKLGEFKWHDLSLPYELTDTQPPSAEQMQQYRMLFDPS